MAADAKSRYEIVNDLVANKTKFIEEIAELEKRVMTNKANVEQKKRDHVRDTDDLKRQQIREIEDVEAGHKALIESTEKLVSIRRTKITALDEAINAIKAISSPPKKE